jgi:hypothetical protein
MFCETFLGNEAVQMHGGIGMTESASSTRRVRRLFGGRHGESRLTTTDPQPTQIA